MVLHCAIHLERDPPVYSPGDVVEGVVVISSTWADKISGISVKLAKKVEVNWDVYKLYDRNSVSNIDDVTFVSECEIIDNGQSADPHEPTPNLSNLVSKRGVVITRGVTHRYPFLLKIAYELDLPSSFRGTYGYIAYKLVAFIRVPKKGFILGASKDMAIFPILDLNHLDLKLQNPVDEKRIFKSRFGYNYVFMKAHLDKKAFLPDDPVNFTVEVTNKSPATLDGVEVNLDMRTHFSTFESSKIESRSLLRIRGPCISQGEHGIWYHSFNFPPALPTALGALSRTSSKFIDVQYTITFSLEVSKAEKFSIPFTIVIGTVPFGRVRSVQHLHMHHNTNSDEARGNGGTALPPSSHHHNHHHHHHHRTERDAMRRSPDSLVECMMSRIRPRSKSTSSLPPSYSTASLHNYHASMLRRAETPPPTYSEARAMAMAMALAAVTP